MSAPLRLWIVPHTHWDREWYLTREGFRARLLRLLDRLLEALERGDGLPHFLLDGQTIVVDDYLELRPRALEPIRRGVAEGRLAVGPWRVLPDEWLVSGEALIRNLRHGLRRAAELGGTMPIGYVPDSFGHVGQLPQILAGFGLEAAVVWRGVGEDVERTAFWWEAPDGTRLFTVYLANGYGNAAHLPRDPEALATRLLREAHALDRFSPGPSRLLMNGSDHLEPQLGLPEALEAARPKLGETSCAITSLAEAVRRLREEAGDAVAVHRGELRSGLRAPLLPGCASARAPLKRFEFRNDTLVTRWLEPLSAWLGALGGKVDLDLLHSLWELILENHPHDSVCGCSIDRVHDEMATRFRRVEEMAGAELARVTGELGRRIRLPEAAGGGPWLAVWNPHASGRFRAEGELELACGRDPHRWHLRDASGRTLPVAVEVLRPARTLLALRLPKAAVEMVLPALGIEFFDGYLQEARWKRRGGRLRVELRVGSVRPEGFDFEAAKAALERELADAAVREVELRAWQPPRLRIAIVDSFPGCGLRLYRVERGRLGSDSLAAERLADGGGAIENTRWRIEASAEGRIALVDRERGHRTDDALRFVSEGDRGDSYNFDPVPGAAVVDRPQRARVRAHAEGGEARLVVEADYAVPAGLARDRKARSRRRVRMPVRLELRLAPGLDRIDLRVRLENRARDHRFRLHVRAPFSPRRFEAESAYEIAERPLSVSESEPGRPAAERPTAACPARRFASLIGDELALTLATRGLHEVEAIAEPEGGWSLAVTLLRAVGWLSRDDLASRPNPAGPPLPVPGAQVLGPHEAELSLRLHPATDPWRAAAAIGFAQPPLVFAAEPTAGGALGDGARLVEIEDPAVEAAAIEPRPQGGAVVRLCHLRGERRRVRLAWGPDRTSRLEQVDLAERLARGKPPAPAPRGEAEFDLGPWEIATLRVERTSAR